VEKRLVFVAYVYISMKLLNNFSNPVQLLIKNRVYTKSRIYPILIQCNLQLTITLKGGHL